MFCDDAERQELLKKIHRLLKLFLKNQCLAPRILSWMWNYTMQELEETIHLGFKDLVPILEQTQTPLSICFLWPEQLEVVFYFLEELSKECDLEDNISDDGGDSGAAKFMDKSRKLDKELAGLVFQFVKTDFSLLKYFYERKYRLLEYQETYVEKKFGLDETLISTNTQFPDLECQEDKANRDILLDVCVKEATKMEKQNVVREVDLQACNDSSTLLTLTSAFCYLFVNVMRLFCI
ncbi:hypothetical protein DKX38_023956 [Salix brachista]|uniref:DUF629 domain-containing protein n=1 Tax=Salix brachista TaxID=2182728 RepID=A0A5N5JXU0_9ROSI|nr:hypothetical protein DKX38_023956 [Salix brachista]